VHTVLAGGEPDDFPLALWPLPVNCANLGVPAHRPLQHRADDAGRLAGNVGEGLELIRSYGLHWHSDKVFWGKPRVAGTLLGAASRSKSAKEIDFRLQRGIYALYANYELVYVGQTGSGDDRLFKRLRTHNRDHLSERWNRFSWFGTQWVTQQGVLSANVISLKADVAQVLNILEAISTAISEPRLNLQRGRWSKATQYYQYIPDQEEEEED
jgi:hypothetical protein